METRSKLVATIGAGVVLIAVIGWLVSYSPREFRGAGALRDSGYFSWEPRYEAPLGELRLSSEGTHSLRFSGLPDHELSLLFYLDDYTFDHREALLRVSTVIRAEISDENGTTLCSVTGSPDAPAGQFDRDWVLSSTPFYSAYYHRGCLELPFQRRTEYTLRVDIIDPDPKAPDATLRAVLEGGGFATL